MPVCAIGRTSPNQTRAEYVILTDPDRACRGSPPVAWRTRTAERSQMQLPGGQRALVDARVRAPFGVILAQSPLCGPCLDRGSDPALPRSSSGPSDICPVIAARSGLRPPDTPQEEDADALTRRREPQTHATRVRRRADPRHVPEDSADGRGRHHDDFRSSRLPRTSAHVSDFDCVGTGSTNQPACALSVDRTSPKETALVPFALSLGSSGHHLEHFRPGLPPSRCPDARHAPEPDRRVRTRPKCLGRAAECWQEDISVHQDSGACKLAAWRVPWGAGYGFSRQVRGPRRGPWRRRAAMLSGRARSALGARPRQASRISAWRPRHRSFP